MLAMVACIGACTPPDPAAEVTRRDSAGIEIVTVPAAAFAALPAWTIDTGTRLMTIGGEDPDQDVDRIAWAVKLDDENILIGKTSPMEIRLHGADGGFIRHIGRRGDGPGEFRYALPYQVRSDTVLFWDGNQQRLTWMRTDGTVVRTSDFKSIPRTLFLGVGGGLADGKLVTMPMGWYQDTNVSRLDGGRLMMPIYLIDIERMTVDTQPGYPGVQVYQGEAVEAGRTFPTPREYELDGSTVILTTDSGMTVAFPMNASVLLRRSDGTIRRQTLLPLEGRPVTPELRERYIAGESTYVAGRPYGADYLTTLRKARFSERMPVFTKIQPGPAGEVWLALSTISSDTTREFVVLDASGAPAATAGLPAGWNLLWIGKDHVLATWRDEDDVTYLSAYPLHRVTSR